MQFTMKKVLPIGSYRGILKSIEDANHDEFGAGVRFTFLIEHGAEKGQECQVTCNSERPPTAKNRLGRMLSGLSGRKLQPGESCDASAFVGRKFVFMVDHN